MSFYNYKKVGKVLYNRYNHLYILIPILFLILGSIIYLYSLRQVEYIRVQEKFQHIKNNVNMIYTAVEANKTRSPEAHKQNIQEGINYMDELPSIYAACFEYNNDTKQYDLFTSRNMETEFNPFNYNEFVTLIKNHEEKDLIINFTPNGQENRDLYVYYKFMPTYVPNEKQYLIIAGCSKFSIINHIPLWISITPFICILFTFGYVFYMVLQKTTCKRAI